MTDVDEPAIINPNDGGPDWAPMCFRGQTDSHGIREMIGMAKRWFCVFCPEALGYDTSRKRRPITVVHLPTGLAIAECKHGAQAYRLCEDLFGIREFSRPFNESGLQSRVDDIERIYREHGAWGEA